VGAALVLDSFDNNAQGDNPRLSLILNDGSKVGEDCMFFISMLLLSVLY
jgi:hypothetical protein